LKKSQGFLQIRGISAAFTPPDQFVEGHGGISAAVLPQHAPGQTKAATRGRPPNNSFNAE
jgi:hypothetical protein